MENTSYSIILSKCYISPTAMLLLTARKKIGKRTEDGTVIRSWTQSIQVQSPELHIVPQALPGVNPEHRVRSKP